MINSQYSNLSTASAGSGFTAGPVSFQSAGLPPVESLNIRAAQVAGGIAELNQQLASLRSKLFGEGESSPPHQANGPMPSLVGCIETAQMEIQSAHAQISSILNRL